MQTSLRRRFVSWDGCELENALRKCREMRFGAERKEPAAQNDRQRYIASGAIGLPKAWAAWGELAKKAHRSDVGRRQKGDRLPHLGHSDTRSRLHSCEEGQS